MQYTKTRLGAPASSARLERAWRSASIFTVASKSTFNPSSPHVGTVKTSMFLLLQHGVQLGTAYEGGAKTRVSVSLSLSLASLSRASLSRAITSRVKHDTMDFRSSHSRIRAPRRHHPPSRSYEREGAARRRRASPASRPIPLLTPSHRRHRARAHRIASHARVSPPLTFTTVRIPHANNTSSRHVCSNAPRHKNLSITSMMGSPRRPFRRFADAEDASHARSRRSRWCPHVAHVVPGAWSCPHARHETSSSKFRSRRFARSRASSSLDVGMDDDRRRVTTTTMDDGRRRRWRWTTWWTRARGCDAWRWAREGV